MKFNLSKEILCLILIICSSIMLGKVLMEVKYAINDRVESLTSHIEHLNYSVYSYRPTKKVEKLDEITVIRNVNDMKMFKEEKIKDLDIDWLNEKLNNYADENFYTEHTLVVLCLENYGRTISNRVTDIYKENTDVTIKIDKKILDTDIRYSWIAVIDIEDLDSDIGININKV